MDLHVMLHPIPHPATLPTTSTAALLYAGPEATRDFVGAVTLAADVAQAFAARVNAATQDGAPVEPTEASLVVCYLDIDGDAWVLRDGQWWCPSVFDAYDDADDLAKAFGPLTPLVRQ